MSTDPLAPTFLTPLSEFLREIRRTYGWYRDNVDNPNYSPQVPKLVKQGRSNFIVTAHGERYKRELLQKAGVPTVGRPRKEASQ